MQQPQMACISTYNNHCFQFNICLTHINGEPFEKSMDFYTFGTFVVTSMPPCRCIHLQPFYEYAFDIVRDMDLWNGIVTDPDGLKYEFEGMIDHDDTGLPFMDIFYQDAKDPLSDMLYLVLQNTREGKAHLVHAIHRSLEVSSKIEL